MEIVIHFIVSTIATFAFAKLFNAPTKELLYCGITGGIGWVIYFILSNNNLGVVLPMLISSFGLTIFARIIAAVRRVLQRFILCAAFSHWFPDEEFIIQFIISLQEKPVLQENMDLVHLRLP